MQNQRMRIGPPPKPQWKTVAIATPDPIAFARELQTSLQELTDQGYVINSQMARGDALIITASRLPPTEPPPALRRRVVDLPSARSSGVPFEEVLYHYLEAGEQKQRNYPSLVDALRALKEDLGREGVSAVNNATVSLTSFEPESLSYLLRMFAEDLQPPPG